MRPHPFGAKLLTLKFTMNNVNRFELMKQVYNDVEFLLSAAKLHQLPADEGIEVAFAGRSNAGKSSALNTITGIKSLARTSKTPGRTQQINVFELDEERRLIDLPGYGYAKVSHSVREHWQKTLAKYLEVRQCLRGLVLMMDIRHPLKPLDVAMLEWANESDLAVHILLTKADKLKRGAAMSTLLRVKKSLEVYSNETSIQLFSSLKETGVDEAHKKLNEWFAG